MTEELREELTPLRKYQLVELQILKEFMRVCKENNLTWWVGAGTLLGAVRHKGFIPWDDDIDLFMPVEDYLKFRELALHGALNDEYYFQCHTTCVYDPIYQQRIGLKNTTSLPRDYCSVPGKWGICIDIFPLAPAPALDDAPGSKIFAKAEKRFHFSAAKA